MLYEQVMRLRTITGKNSFKQMFCVLDMQYKIIGKSLIIYTVLLAATFILVWFVKIPYSRYLFYVPPIIGGGVIGYLAKPIKFRNVLVFGIIASLILGVLNYLFSELGMPTDFGTVRGIKYTTFLSMPIILVCSLIGAACFEEIKEHITNKSSRPPKSSVG